MHCASMPTSEDVRRHDGSYQCINHDLHAIDATPSMARRWSLTVHPTRDFACGTFSFGFFTIFVGWFIFFSALDMGHHRRRRRLLARLGGHVSSVAWKADEDGDGMLYLAYFCAALGLHDLPRKRIGVHRATDCHDADHHRLPRPPGVGPHHFRDPLVHLLLVSRFFWRDGDGERAPGRWWMTRRPSRPAGT